MTGKVRKTVELEGWPGLLREVDAVAHGADYPRLARRAAKLEAVEGPPAGALRPRIALLGGAALEFLEGPLRLALASNGIWPEALHLADFDQALVELLDPSSGTAGFAPDLVLVSFPNPEVCVWPQPGDDSSSAQRCAEELCTRYIEACRSLNQRTGAEIVFDNFAPRPTESHGNLAARTPGSARSFLRRANLVLGDTAPRFVHLHDVAALVESEGLLRWHDARFWHHARQPVSFECLPSYARSLAAVITGILGRARKLLVCDLDNTLWGGVVGEDGLEGIAIGEGNPAGEPHTALQRYLRELRERGVLLAVCTKNDPHVAELPFREHPEMTLQLEDFAAFDASWDAKSEGIRRIAERLDLGLDSIVFLDDNPAERMLVRSFLPEVRVPELPDDPAGYLAALESGRHFEVPSIESEDLRRTEAYRARSSAAELEQRVGDYDAYLSELGMEATIRPFTSSTMARVAQLVGKTNQFNLTSERLTRAQLEEIAADPRFVTRTLQLSDRFGDHGLVSVLIGEIVESALDLRVWLMSCRVLRRRVEEVMLDVAADAAERAGARELHGAFRPTDRNALVRNLYDDLGFERTDDQGDVTRWSLPLERFTPHSPPIELKTDG